MKTKINWNEIESKTDFTTMNEKLLAASGNGGLNRRKTAVHLLEKVKDALLKVRSEGASFSAIANSSKSTDCPSANRPSVNTFANWRGIPSRERNPRGTKSRKPKLRSSLRRHHQWLLCKILNHPHLRHLFMSLPVHEGRALLIRVRFDD